MIVLLQLNHFFIYFQEVDIDITPTKVINSSLRTILPKPRNLFPEPTLPADHSYRKKPKSRASKSGNTSANKEVPQKENSVGFATVQQIIDSLTLQERYLTSEEVADLLNSLLNASVKVIAKEIMKIPHLKSAVETLLLSDLSRVNKLLTNRKKGRLSVLMKGTFDNLKSFNWDEVVKELWEEFPLLAKAVVSFIVPSSMENHRKSRAIPKLIPKIGTVYGILAQARQNRLSKVQKVVNILLHESICDQKVCQSWQITCHYKFTHVEYTRPLVHKGQIAVCKKGSSWRNLLQAHFQRVTSASSQPPSADCMSPESWEHSLIEVTSALQQVYCKIGKFWGLY